MIPVTLKHPFARSARRLRANRAELLNGMGVKLRLAREQKGMSLRGAAKSLGISPSFMSQVERGKVMPSVVTLCSIANGLGIAVDHLIRPEKPAISLEDRVESIRSASDLVQRRDTRKAIRLVAGVSWERLTALPDTEMEFLYVIFDADASFCPEDTIVRRDGKGYLYVVSGQLGIEIDFQPFTLIAGDSVSWLGEMPYRLWTIGAKPAAAIWAMLHR